MLGCASRTARSLAEEPRPIGDALARVRRELGTPEPNVLDQVRASWTELVGEALAGHSVPLHLRDGVLRVTVDDPVWAGQFRYLADGLVAELRRLVPKAAITQISVGAPRGGTDTPDGSEPSGSRR